LKRTEKGEKHEKRRGGRRAAPPPPKRGKGREEGSTDGSAKVTEEKFTSQSIPMGAKGGIPGVVWSENAEK